MLSSFKYGEESGPGSGYHDHVYKDPWMYPQQAKKFMLNKELDIAVDKCAEKVVKDNETVGHLPREYSRILWYFIARGGKIRVEVTGRRRHCKQLCGGMEIPCRLVFTCSRKAKINRLKELLESNIRR